MGACIGGVDADVDTARSRRRCAAAAEVVFEEDADVISLAADQRMHFLRSFQTGERAKLSQKLLNEISSARVCLLDEAKKATYDTALKQQIEGEKTAASLPAATSPEDLAATLEFAAHDIKTGSDAEGESPMGWRPSGEAAKEEPQKSCQKPTTSGLRPP